MRLVLSTILALSFSLASPVVVRAHEFWVEPARYHVAVGEAILGHLKTGQHFKGVRNLYLPHQFTSFEITDAAGTRPVTGIVGDIPPLNLIADQPGLKVITYLSEPKSLDYTEWEKFEEFLTGMGMAAPLERHRARGLDPNAFTETYIRCAKSLVAVGDGAGADRALGMPLELVALTNPYSDSVTDGMRVQLLWQGAPLVDAQVKLFTGQGDSLQTAFMRTDGDGIALMPNLGPGQYLLNAVQLIEAPEGVDAAWQSYWASLTYAISP